MVGMVIANMRDDNSNNMNPRNINTENTTMTKLEGFRRHSTKPNLVKLPILNIEEIGFDINIKYNERLKNELLAETKFP
jgi:hypothetical protein